MSFPSERVGFWGARLGMVALLCLAIEKIVSEPTGGTALLLQQATFHVPLFLMLWLTFRRRLTPFVATALVACGWAAAATGLVDEALHSVFLRLDVYPSLIRPARASSVNPQYAKLFLYAIALPFFGAAVCFRRFRTMDRLFVLVSATASFGAVLLIHYVLVHRGLDFVAEKRLEVMAVVDLQGGESRALACSRLGWVCMERSASEPFSMEGLEPEQERRVDAVRRNALVSGEPMSEHGWKTTGALDRGEVRAQLVHFAYRSTSSGGIYRVSMDPVGYQAHLDRWKGLFGALAGTASSVWVFGGLWLLFRHRGGFGRRSPGISEPPSKEFSA